MKSIIFSVLLFISYHLSASVTHIWPSSGVNDTVKTVHIFGDGFNSGVTNVNLYKTGNPVVTGTNISVINDNYLTCQFDLTGVSTTTYNAIVNFDTLDMCFTVNDYIYHSNNWDRTDLGSGGWLMNRVVVGDGDNDGDLEVYGSCEDNHIYQFTWNGFGWVKTDLGSGAVDMNGVAVGDGNNDGELEVYGACFDAHIYQFSWNGSTWDKIDIGSGGAGLLGVEVGDGNNDGELEVYGACWNFHIYQFKYNSSSWDIMDIGSGGSYIRGVAVGDGNNDGELEVYGACLDNHIYQFSWNGATWDKTDLGSGEDYIYGVAVGDGNNDGELEVYGACRDDHIYQFSWNGATWDKIDHGSGGDDMFGVAVGDGNNDGEMEVYGSCRDDHIYQFNWNGSSWDSTDLGSCGNDIWGIVVGDGNNDGEIEVYGACGNYHIYQIKVIPEPKLVLQDTSYDFSFTALNDTSFWQYMSFENIGDTFLIIDSVISTNNDFYTYNFNLPDTVDIDDSSLVEIAFTPTMEGLIEGSLVIYSNDPFDTVQFVCLQGIGDSTAPSVVNLILPIDSSYHNNSNVDFIWSSSQDTLSGIEHYLLIIFYDAFADTGLIDTNIVDTTFNITLPDNIYFWEVKAFDQAGNESPWSDLWSFEVDIDIPSIPSLISPIGGNYYSNDTVDFNWTAVRFKDSESPVRYIFEIDTVSTFSTPSTDTVENNTVEKILTEDFYYWHVKAFDLAGNESPFSNPDSFGIDITSPVIESTTIWNDTSFTGPFSIYTNVLDNISVDTVFLYFKRLQDPAWFYIEMIKGTNNWYYEEIPQTSLNPDTIKYYIYAEDIAQPANVSTDPVGAPGNYYSFVVYQVGVAEITEIPGVFSFSYSYSRTDEIIFNLALPDVSDISLKIFEISGREVVELISGQLTPAFYTIPFRPLSSGTYFYRLESSYQSKSGKFIIIK